MKTKSLVVSCILLSVGFVLHALVPGIGTMKPDFMLAMMILAIVINPTFEVALSTGLLAGILSALTSVFPGGQILSLFDKVIAAFVVLAILKGVGAMKPRSKVVLVSAVGTLVSGMVFLTGACFVLNMGTSVFSLFPIVVLPTIILNLGLNDFIYTRVLSALKLN